MPPEPYTPGPGGGADRRLGKHSSCRASMCLRGACRPAMRQACKVASLVTLPASLPLDLRRSPLSPERYRGVVTCPSQQVAKPPCPAATIENAHTVRGKIQRPQLNLPESPAREVSSQQYLILQIRDAVCFFVIWSVVTTVISGRIKPLKDPETLRARPITAGPPPQQIPVHVETSFSGFP